MQNLDEESGFLLPAGGSADSRFPAEMTVELEDACMLLTYYAYYMGHNTEEPIGVIELFDGDSDSWKVGLVTHPITPR